MVPSHKDDTFQRIGTVDDTSEKFAVADCMEVPIDLLRTEVRGDFNIHGTKYF